MACNRKVIESLSKAGASDSLGQPRKGLCLVHGEAIDAVMESKRAKAVGQFDLFGYQAGTGGGLDCSTCRCPPTTGHADHWDTPTTGTPSTSLRWSGRGGTQVIVGGILASVTRRVNREQRPDGRPQGPCAVRVG